VTPDYEGGSIEAEGLVWERVALAYTYVKHDRFTLERVMRLRDALYRFGHETRQTRIGVELIDPERSQFLVVEKDKYNWA
jgi:hypothetical protein